MEDKDAINPFNNEISTIPERELTPAQVIANNTEILCLIFGNIVKFKERKNVELTCKKFYEVCNHKSLCSYFPLEEKGHLHFSMGHDGVNVEIDILGQEMTVNIPEKFTFDKNNTDIIARFFSKYLSKVNTLDIVDMSLEHVDFFVNLNCFEKIKNLIVGLRARENRGDVILSKCSTLNPVNLKIPPGYLNRISMENIDQYALPDSIRTIRMNFNSLKWLLAKIETKKLGTFDNLECDGPLSSFMEKVYRNKIYLKLIIYFKNISFTVYGFETILHNEEFNKILFENNIGSFLTIIFNNNYIYERFSHLRNNERSRVAGGYFQNLEDPKNRFLAQPGVYLNIKKLKILDVYKKRIYCPFFPIEIEKMKEDILRMKYLSVFEVYFYLFGHPNDFKKLCTSLGRIETIRIHYCKKMNLRSLMTLSVYAGNLKNISLVGINDESIRTSIILSHFKNLESLEIIFRNSYSTFRVFKDLMNYDCKKGFVFNWPNLQYLNIICNRPNFEHEIYLDQLKRNTPRKSGQLLIRNILFYDNPAYQILARLSKKAHIFDSPLCNGRFELNNL
uniref:F-box domain-containing protein n=1 Tax=Strongyloides papillosus TaxID=174720 RepID=A0A0N5BN05_STREA